MSLGEGRESQAGEGRRLFSRVTCCWWMAAIPIVVLCFLDVSLVWERTEPGPLLLRGWGLLLSVVLLGWDIRCSVTCSSSPRSQNTLFS